MHAFLLVVDDDGAVRGLLQLTLENEGYEVATAGDGLEALERLDERCPDLILLDLGMPRMGGPALAGELVRRGLRPPLPILVISADTDARKQARGMEADGYLAKPFAIDGLLAAVERLVPA